MSEKKIIILGGVLIAAFFLVIAIILGAVAFGILGYPNCLNWWITIALVFGPGPIEAYRLVRKDLRKLKNPPLTQIAESGKMDGMRTPLPWGKYYEYACSRCDVRVRTNHRWRVLLVLRIHRWFCRGYSFPGSIKDLP